MHGQSEHRASPHYREIVEPWIAGHYRPMLWTREQVEAGAKATLTLTPPGTSSAVGAKR